MFYAELLSSADDSKRFRDSPLAIVQGLVMIYFFVNMIILALESQYVHFINVYIYVIIYASLGALLVLLIQCIIWGMYLKGNRYNASNTAVVTYSSGLYTGWPHTKEVSMGVIMSVLAWAFTSWQLGEWLSRFGKTASSSNPDVTHNPEYTLYFGAVQISMLLNFVAVVALIRAFVAHVRPTRVITTIFQEAASDTELKDV